MRMFILIAALAASPAGAAELWCMPDTLCNASGECRATTNEETSLRIANLSRKRTTMRSHTETSPMKRTKAGTAVEWRGTNESGATEYVIWSTTTNTFTYTQANQNGDVWKSTGTCEVQ